jgi:predicted nucleotidyltransferase
MVSQDILKEAVRRLVEQFHPEKIILFGSQVRGTADSRSDIDLLVISPIKEKRRELMVEMNRVVHHIWEAIRFENTESITSVFKGEVRKYRPDFIVRLKNGKNLILEA